MFKQVRCIMMLLFSLITTMVTRGQKTDGIVHTLPIPVCLHKTTMLVFPASIKDADRGSGDIIIKAARKTTNVLKVKAAKENFEPTNLSVLTDDGRLFSINVVFQENPGSLAYRFGSDSSSTPAVHYEEGINPAILDSLASAVAYAKALTHHPRAKAFRMRMNLRGIYFRDGLLFFAFDILNKSDIPFDIYFTRFYVRDRGRSKRTSQMEKEVEPRMVFFTKDSCVVNHLTNTMVAVFDKFTIADNKYFSAELYEKNGDRQLECHIKGRHLLKARPFSPDLMEHKNFH